jgi:hypothetical protein
MATITGPNAATGQPLRAYEADPAVPVWRDLLAARHWRWIGTAIRVAAALMFLVCVLQQH